MTTFKTKFWQNAQILNSRVPVSNFKPRSFNNVSVSKVMVLTASLV